LAEGETLLPPGTLRTGAGTPYAVFTPFARAFAQACVVGDPVRAPSSLPPLPAGVGADTVSVPTCDDLGFPPNPRLLPGGEKAARQRLRRFVKEARHYHERRDRLDLDATSRLSQDI